MTESSTTLTRGIMTGLSADQFVPDYTGSYLEVCTKLNNSNPLIYITDIVWASDFDESASAYLIEKHEKHIKSQARKIADLEQPKTITIPLELAEHIVHCIEWSDVISDETYEELKERIEACKVSLYANKPIADNLIVPPISPILIPVGRITAPPNTTGAEVLARSNLIEVLTVKKEGTGYIRASTPSHSMVVRLNVVKRLGLIGALESRNKYINPNLDKRVSEANKALIARVKIADGKSLESLWSGDDNG